jgi:hypothetical protein
MPIRFAADHVVLTGVCQVEEADRLRVWLCEHPAAPVSLGGLTYAHTAIVQVLMAARSQVSDWPVDAGLAEDLSVALATAIG